MGAGTFPLWFPPTPSLSSIQPEVLVNTGQLQWQMASAQVTAVMIRNASEAYPPSELSDQWGL